MVNNDKRFLTAIEANCNGEEESSQPMLISFEAGAKLGFIFDADAVTLKCKHTNDYLKLYRTKGTGMIMFRLNEWPERFDQLLERDPAR